MPSPYDNSAKYYDRLLAPFERWYISGLRREAMSLLAPDEIILEVGAGTGANFDYYPRCRHSVASEVSIKMIEVARGKTKTIDLVGADAEALPFPESYFDAAFASLVFCSVRSPEKAFAELIRILKPGGRIVLLEHVRPNGMLGYLFDLMSILSIALIDDHFNRRTADTLARSGFKIIEIREKAFGIVNVIVGENHK